VIGTNAAITVSPTSTTTYYVTVGNSTTGCESTCSKIVTVIPLPECSITAADAVCDGSEDNIASTTPQGGVTYLWSIEGNGTIIGPTNGYQITWDATQAVS
jgi:hypothetical protein